MSRISVVSSSTYVKGMCDTGTVPKSLPLIELSDALCCPPVAAGVVSDDDALEVALRLKALADPVRIKLLSLVLAAGAEGMRNVDLARELALTDATISHHLGQLGRAGLLVATRQGASTYYAADRAALGALVRVMDPDCC
jgi:DNA-binding transcriptional ArsR family regulator